MVARSRKNKGKSFPDPPSPEVMVYVCRNSISGDKRLPRQWSQDGAHVLVQEVPCSGKVDGQYLIQAFEGGVAGLCVVACPKGDCTLAQGNYRAELRIRTVQRLLSEIGLEPERAELLLRRPDDSVEHLEGLVRGAVARFCALGESPIRQHLHEKKTG
jgi:F420-non-reducing hydrogenase iron-sulfur subunit